MSMADTSSNLFNFSSKGIVGGINGIGGAVQDLFNYEGTKYSAESDRLAAGADRLAASSYTQAAGIAGENLTLEEQSVAIKETQADREIYQNDSSQRATAAANGFQEAGSAAAILADSANQGQLQKTLIQQQGDIVENATRQQILSLNTQAQEANTQALMQDNAANAAGEAGTGALIGGAFKAISGIASLALL
jgi:hypothetical protein